MKKTPPYRCLYNHEMLINFTTQTPVQSYEEPVTKRQFAHYVEEVGDTQVDAIMCCPTAWRLPIYHSKVNDVWQTWGRELRSPLPEGDWKYFDKVFERVRRYMLAADYEDPLRITIDAARRLGKSVLFTYRMNDNHYTHYRDEREVPTMDPLWRDHPEWRIPSMNGVRSVMNYHVPEVRAWYHDILEELARNYDVDGLELDLMRHCDFFPEGEVGKGLEVMTGFVRGIRAMLDAVGKGKGRRLTLGVRVPWTLEHGLEAGLDVARWQREGLLDFINVSTHFRVTAEHGMAGYRRALPDAALYGELHFCSGGARNGLPLGGSRHTTREVYRTGAHSYLEQGADGISLFNFCYCRDHHYNDPRLRYFLHPEPPFDVLKTILDRKTLAAGPRHYVTCPGFGLLPRTFPAPEPFAFDFQVDDDPVRDGFARAVLRLQFSELGLFPAAFTVTVNGKAVPLVPGSGELSAPESNEGLAAPLELFFFQIPPALLKRGANRITIFVSPFAEFFFMQTKKVQLLGIDLGLAR